MPEITFFTFFINKMPQIDLEMESAPECLASSYSNRHKNSYFWLSNLVPLENLAFLMNFWSLTL